ncbi:hypothetical protein HPB52_022168 [Rhipicephalus sanguineus]|uniref:Uncharacterized protein n=1 Tax=Rhipicephalus sanguineus TaxID=34632 RepID=A0A9D4QB37_RHISA|nr:hypothetical protein HPB52_022168 [Rhipicephalus sanguineus]
MPYTCQPLTIVNVVSSSNHAHDTAASGTANAPVTLAAMPLFQRECQVHSTVKGLFYTTAAVSVLGGVCSLWYLTLLWSSRYVYFNAGLRRTLGDPGDLVGEQYSAADRNDAAPDQLTAS